ncbi:E3 ubiquitin-protein ligase HECW2-like isoform X3 [Asterias rubens]|uniref:E3 ubiquitin-protein ligase HECW2-like isoform X3 n=1 Tax=Asterias rubens TaxID=7604 RepID=UPI0014551263|nr:E3 ubiquitin-protein ligase HECW2-like isoform X3 [Asterias rubens]
MTDREALKMAANPGLANPGPAPTSLHDRLGLFASLHQTPTLRAIRRLSVHDRSNSDSNLAHPDLQRWSMSSLMVNKHDITLRPDAHLIVYWDIKDSVDVNDWIGLYLIGENSPTNFQSFKNRGLSATHKGQIVWHLDSETCFTKPVTRVCFKYYHGTTGELRAITPTITVRNPDASEDDEPSPDNGPFFHICISDLKGMGLKKGMFFNPDPYIKFSIQPGRNHNLPLSDSHYGQDQRTTIAEKTVMPSWDDQEFHFKATRTDVLELELKDKFVRSRPIISRFLGRLAIPIQRLVEKAALGERTVTYNLNKRHPSDHVSGCLTFTVEIEQEDSPEADSVVNGTADQPLDHVTRSVSVPAMATLHEDRSLDGPAVLPRAVQHLNSNTVETPTHAKADRTISAPAQYLGGVSRGVKVVAPDTPTESISNPISQEQLSQAAQRTNTQSIGEIQSIQCSYVLPDKMTSNDKGKGGSVRRTSPSRPTELHIPGSKATSLQPDVVAPAVATQTALSPEFGSRNEGLTMNVTAASSLTRERTPDVVEDTMFQLTLDDSENSSESSVRTERRSNVETVSSRGRRSDSAASLGTSNRPSSIDMSSFSGHKRFSNQQTSALSSSLPSRQTSTLAADRLLSNENLVARALLSSSPMRIPPLSNSPGASPTASPASRRRDISDISLQKEIEEEVNRLRMRSGTSMPSRDPETPTNTPIGTPLIDADMVARSAPDDRLPGKTCVASVAQSKKLQVVKPSTRQVEPINSSTMSESDPGPRNNNNSQTQPVNNEPQSQTAAVPNVINLASEGGSSTIEPLSVNNIQHAEAGGESSPDGAVSQGTSNRSTTESESFESGTSQSVGSESSDPKGLDGEAGQSAKGGAHPNDNVWQRRKKYKSSRPNLRVNITGVTTDGTDLDAERTPTTPVLTPQRVTYQRYELPADEEPLPNNWEARIDQYGRVFYINHVQRTTTWTKPKISHATQQEHHERDSQQSRQQLDRRYQSIHRTLQRQDHVAEESSSASTSTDSIAEIQTPRGRHSFLEAPAVKFITRPDFFTILHSNAEAKQMFQRNSSVKHMVNRIRRDPGKFSDYQHNRDLVALLNLYVDHQAELPGGWESKQDKSAKVFFVDHTSHSTTFIDPRLPVEVTDPTVSLLQVPTRGRMRSRSEGEGLLDGVHENDFGAGATAGHGKNKSGPPIQPRPKETLRPDPAKGKDDAVPLAYNEKVVAFLRQPNIIDILKERQEDLSTNTKLRDKIHLIRQEGISALQRLSNDVELIMLLSLFEDDVMSYTPTMAQASSQLRSSLANISPHNTPQPSPHSSPVGRANARAPAPYRRDFDAKLRGFYRKMEAKGYGQGPTKLKLTIRRDHLLEDAFGKIMAISRKDIQKCKLFISFPGEEGLDYGGPSREFFFLLSRELFNPYYGLFEYSAMDTYTVQISPMSAFVDNYLDWFRFCGRVIGLAIIHHFLLDAFFTRPFYKALLRSSSHLSDLESLDSEFYQSLLWTKENDITDVLDLTFTVDEETFGQLVEKELKPNGKNIQVTEKNKKEYIERMVKWRIERGVMEQTESLVRGFYEVVDTRLISVFDARELELVIAGTAEIDIHDWRKNTEYRGGYQDKHHVINWFWTAVECFDNERRLRLLQFVTGTSSIPYEGFAALRGSNGPRKFCIEKWGKVTSLPRAHTCFNRLDLPSYSSYAMLLEKLVIAVEETSTFGID